MNLEWQAIKEELREGLSRGQYDLWVSILDWQRVEEDVLVLGCKNWLHMEWVRGKLEKRLLTAVQRRFPRVRKITYEIITEDTDLLGDTEMSSGTTVEGPRQVSITDLMPSPRPRFNPRFTFNHFVVGRSNQFAYAASLAMADRQSFLNQGVYLVADSGLGKSHLTHAVGNELLSRQGGDNVRYVTAEQFTNEMICCLKKDQMESFKRKYRERCDVLLLERVEFFSGKKKIQDELIYTMDELLDRGKRIVCTGSVPPKDIPNLKEGLRSRLGGVLVAPIERPDFQTRYAIIKRKASYDNVDFPNEVAEFLAERITGDVRQLESCVVGIIAKSNILKVPICLALAKDVTQTMLAHLPKLTVDHVIQIVCANFQISVDDLRSATRSKQLSLARHMGMYLCRRYTSDSLASIGKAFGRSHSTVIYAMNKISKGLNENNRRMKRELEHLSQRLETKCLY